MSDDDRIQWRATMNMGIGIANVRTAVVHHFTPEQIEQLQFVANARGITVDEYLQHLIDETTREFEKAEQLKE